MGLMKCPRCVQRIHRSASQCPHCGFSMRDLNAQFGDGDVRMRKLSDAAGVLKLTERKKANVWLKDFEERFPQLFFSVYYGALDEISNIRQFGMWLLNHGAFEDVDLSRPNDGGVLLIIDVNSRTATISFGYLLDEFLTENDTFKILSAAHPYLLQGNHVRALKVIINKISAVLGRRAARAKRRPEYYERIAGKREQGMRDVLQRIRPSKRHGKIETRNHERKGARG